MTPEEQVAFARQRCRGLANLRLSPFRVRQSLQAERLDQAIVDEAIEEYERLYLQRRGRDRLWWRIAAFAVFALSAAYLVSAAFAGQPQFHKSHAVALGVALLALLQTLMPLMPRNS